MTAPDMNEGEVLWIDPQTYLRTGCPNGFPMRVVRFAGRADADKVWVRGVILEPHSGVPVDETTIAVPLDQPRAVRGGNALRQPWASDPPPPPAVAVAEVPTANHAGRRNWHDANEMPYAVSERRPGDPPAGYRRVI